MSGKQTALAPRPCVGLALAGGGPAGAIYEIGALRAIEEAIEGLDLTDIGVYVGVSAGSFVAACLANGLSTANLCRSAISPRHGAHPFVPETFFTPALGEFVGRGLTLPGLALESVADYAAHAGQLTLVEAFTRLSRALPVALFDNAPVRDYLQRIFGVAGRSDDFRELRNRLFVIAADLDSGEAVRFGEPGHDDVPISVAVQASSALPGLYPPVQVGERYYLDGVLLKTLHASVGLEAGAELLICVNPIVPVDTSSAVSEGVMRRGRLIHRGLPAVLSQTFRTLVHSRLAAGLASYEPRFPDKDIVLFEPPTDDYRMFFTNIFSFSSRRAVCEHAYLSTLRQLRERRAELAPILARHGLTLRQELLADEGRTLSDSIGPLEEPARRPTGAPVAERLDRALDRLESTLGAARP